MKVKFLRKATYPQNDPANSRVYEEGKVYDLPDDHAQRWIRRNAAVEVPKSAAKKVEVSEPKEPEAKESSKGNK